MQHHGRSAAGGPRRALVLDLGGVLIEWDPRAAYREHFPGEEGLVERFLTGPFDELGLRSCEVADPLAEVAAPFVTRYPEFEALLRHFVDHWSTFVRGAMPQSVALVERAAGRGARLFGLTNWPASTFPPQGDAFAFLERFEDIVVSGEMGLRKPQAAIFERALARFGLAPEEVLYVDDRRSNVAAARALGLDAHRFTDASALEACLRSRDLI